MIGTILRVSFLNLRRDRVVLALAFVLPVLFFSIFASVFGQQRDTTAKIRFAVVDLDHSEYSQKLVDALRTEGGLRVRTTVKEDGTGGELDRKRTRLNY